MSKVYISGNVSGCSLDEAVDKLRAAERYLLNRAYTPIKPVLMDSQAEVNHLWYTFYKLNIMAMMQCNVIAFLPDWEQSEIAKLEFAAATALKYHVIFLDTNIYK